MSDNTDIYTVEKILRRQLRGQETFFHIKWEGYQDTTWEPAENLFNCDELLHDFETNIISEILNIRQVGGRLEVLLMPKDNMPCTVVPAAVAIDRWPSLVFDFLGRHVHVVKEPSDPVVTFEVKESEDTNGDPIRIIYVSDVNFGLQYWFEWPCQKGKFVEEDEAIQKWPRLVHDYLVANLQWFPANNEAQFIGFKMVTRSKSRKILSEGFDTTAKVKIQRQLNYDKVLLNKRSKNISRRRTFATASVPKIQSILKRKSMPILVDPATTSTSGQSNSMQAAASAPTLISAGRANTPPYTPTLTMNRATTSTSGQGNLLDNATSTPSSPTACAILARRVYTPPSTPTVTMNRATASASGQGNLLDNATSTPSSPTASAILARRVYTPPVSLLPNGASSTPQKQ